MTPESLPPNEADIGVADIEEKEEEVLKKIYSCPLDIDFPESDDEQTNILQRIEKILLEVQKSQIDMDYIKELSLEENEEELE